jgi:hypothetical protein
MSESLLYNFKTVHYNYDVSDSIKYKITEGSYFDTNRDKSNNVFLKTQTERIKMYVLQYQDLYSKIVNLFNINNIYSLCYAEPGWSENTWILKILRLLIKENRIAKREDWIIPNFANNYPFKNNIN